MKDKLRLKKEKFLLNKLGLLSLKHLQRIELTLRRLFLLVIFQFGIEKRKRKNGRDQPEPKTKNKLKKKECHRKSDK